MPLIFPDIEETAITAEESNKPRFGPGFTTAEPGGLLMPDDMESEPGGLLGPDYKPEFSAPQLGPREQAPAPDIADNVDLAMRRNAIYRNSEEKHQQLRLDYDETVLGMDTSDDQMERADAAGDRFDQYDPNVDTSQDGGPEDSPWYAAHNIANTVFGDEMGLLGIKWDEDGRTWAFENFRDQLIEHPYSTAFTVASYLVPIGAAWMKGARLARHAAKLASETGDVGAVATRGIFGSKIGKTTGQSLLDVAPSLADETMGSTWQAMKQTTGGLNFADHPGMVRTLASHEEFGKKMLNDDSAKVLLDMTDDEIAQAITPKDLKRLLSSDVHQARIDTLKSLGKQDKLSKMHQYELKAHRAFGNTYWASKTDMTGAEVANVDRWMGEAAVGRMLATVPNVSPKGAQTMYKYFAGKITDDDIIRELGFEGAQWADGLKREWKGLFEAQVDEGFQTAEKFGPGSDLAEFHLPAQLKGTPGFGDSSVKRLDLQSDAAGKLKEARVFDPAKAFGGSTMQERKKYNTWADVEPDLDKLITDPHDLAVGGFVRDDTIFQAHRAFRNIITATMKGGDDAARVSHWTKSADDYDKMSALAKKQWVSMDELDTVLPGTSARMREMVKRQAEKEGIPTSGRHPVIERDLVEQFFGAGDDSVQMATNTWGRIFQLLTSVHKTAKTALNPATHGTNSLGNLAFIGMSGVSPWGKTILNDGKVYAHAFVKLAGKAQRMSGKADTVEIGQLLNKDNLIEVFGKDRYIKDQFGTKIDLAEVFADPRVGQMMEAQAFESREGFAHAARVLETMERYEADGFGQATAANVARAVSGMGEAPGIKQTLQTMSAAYLGEDMIPKMQLFTHYIRKGWSTESAMNEVGRRLPQYLTVGHMQKEARKHVLPWITFQTEAARIIKNNMQDFPVSSIAWMHAPNVAQATLFAAGAGPSGPEAEKAGLAEGTESYAKKYSTAYLDEDKAASVLGAFGGASLLSTIGAGIGGAKGALALGLAGGVGGYALGQQSPTTQSINQGERANLARAWIMDFLPMTAVTLSTNHTSVTERVDPYMVVENQAKKKELRQQDVDFAGLDAAAAVADMSPLAVGSILIPLMQVMSSKGSFGEDINSEGFVGQGSYGNKMAMGLLGFLSPPSMQKYGMKLNGPGGELVPMDQIHENNGGGMTLPSTITPTIMGLAAAGLTFAGGKRLQAAKGVVGTTKDVAGKLMSTPAFRKAQNVKAAIPAAGMGAFIGTASTEINTARLMQDLGISTNPNTGRKSGDWVMDGFFNTFTGINKSYAVSPGVTAKHDKRRHVAMKDARISAQKRWQDAIRNNETGRAKQATESIWKNFLYEYAGDPVRAKSRFMDWITTQTKALARSPQYRGMSEADRARKIQVTRQHLEQDVTRFQQQAARDLWVDAGQSRLTKARNVKIVK